MVDHWEKFGPPVYIAVAGYLGLIGKKDGKKGSSNEARPANKPIGTKGDVGNLNDLAQLLSGSGGVLNG
jgi:hypothetical protein